MDTRNDRPGRLAMPRTRGAMSGLMILILGAWGAIIPFVGHYLDLVVGADTAWDMTAARFWLSLVPGVVAALGGILLLRSANRATAVLGAQLALAAGIWFVIGRPLSIAWNGAPWGGGPLGADGTKALELLLYFSGIGAAITTFAGIALGRVSARFAGDEERLAPTRTETGRFRRDSEEVPARERTSVT